MRGVLISAVLAFCLPVAARGAPHRLRVYPNPDLAIYSMAEGADGFLWLATSDGLYRFDGFHYHRITSFPFRSLRFVAFTRDGSLWCGGVEGLARLRNHRFEILLNKEVAVMAAAPDHLFVRLLDGVSLVNLDGSVRQVDKSMRRDLNFDSSGKLWAVCMDPERACWAGPQRPDAFQPSMEIPQGSQAVVRDSLGRFWVADTEHAALLENGRPKLRLERQRSHESDRLAPLLAGRNGQLWFLGETVRGLISKIEFRDRPDHDRFAPICGLEDRRGHLWVARSGEGLVEWIPQPDWQRWFAEDFAGELAEQVVRDRGGAAIVATQKRLYRQHTKPDPQHGEQHARWSPLGAEERRYYALLPLADGDLLASIGKYGSGRLLRISSNGTVVEKIRDLLPQGDQYREIFPDRKGRIWVGTKRALLRLEGQPGSLHLRLEDLPGVQPGEWVEPVDMELDSAGRLWVGYNRGIAWLDDQDRWHQLVTDQPVTMVRSFALAGDDIWVAHRRIGAFSRLHREGDRWRVALFTVNAGYGPVETEFLKRDTRGWIWRGSSDGVHISDGRHVAPNDWIHLDLGNGLAVNETGQYGFFEDTDGSVWIAGEEGVSHLSPDPAWFDAPRGAPPPSITRVEADGRVFLFPDAPPAELPADTKVLSIDAGTLTASPFRDDALRYRLLPASPDWRPAHGGTIEFRNLPRHLYTLEIGYMGNGAAAVATYPFQIGPATTGPAWPWLTGFLLVSLALVPLVRRQAWFAKAEFRVEKSLFVMRRRYSQRKYAPDPRGPSDYAGETFLARYRLGRVVSRGGFSVVYEARDLGAANGRVAVKVLNRSAGDAGWLRDRFAHEVAALRSVDHPGVVRILDTWIGPAGEPCLAMPFLEGPTLRAALLTAAPFQRARAAGLIRQLGAALAVVHAHGIVHRDLKPENLILLRPETEREQIVMIDFGTAALRSRENELVATTLLSGSFHYMAPERLTGRYSAASDIFSLAVVILEILAGKRLSDLPVMFSDPSFRGELQKSLGTQLARHLAPAFDPDPQGRPAEAGSWTEGLAAALDQA